MYSKAAIQEAMSRCNYTKVYSNVDELIDDILNEDE